MKAKLLAAIVILLSSAPAGANPYLPKPGERTLSMRVSTCAVSGGFIHLYTALDNGLFDKYGIKLENVFIRGSAQNLTALATDEVQFTYCASDAIIPGMAAGIEVKIVASPLVKLPYVLITRKEVRRPEDLKGKALGIARAGDLSDRLSRAVVKKLGLSPEAVTIRPIGGSQGERYQAMAAGIVHGVIITPPLDVRAKNEGYNVMYRLIDLNIPFIYSSLHTSYKMLRERPEIVQRMVAAFAEIIYFVEKNPDKAKAAVSKAMRTNGRRSVTVRLRHLRQGDPRPHDGRPGKRGRRNRRDGPPKRQPGQKKAGRDLRQQLRQQSGEERLSERDLG